jgi:hypothetical protein
MGEAWDRRMGSETAETASEENFIVRRIAGGAKE